MEARLGGQGRRQCVWEGEFLSPVQDGTLPREMLRARVQLLLPAGLPTPDGGLAAADTPRGAGRLHVFHAAGDDVCARAGARSGIADPAGALLQSPQHGWRPLDDGGRC